MSYTLVFLCVTNTQKNKKSVQLENGPIVNKPTNPNNAPKLPASLLLNNILATIEGILIQTINGTRYCLIPDQRTSLKALNKIELKSNSIKKSPLFRRFNLP